MTAPRSVRRMSSGFIGIHDATVVASRASGGAS